MYNEKLEQLIDAALADGVLTEKEKQILFKKAQEMGVDLDEFEMVLDARLVKLKKAEEEKAQASAPKSNKLGDVRKCPACGAIVQSYQGTCPDCGYAFENIEANSSSQKLADILDKIMDEYKSLKLKPDAHIPTINLEEKKRISNAIRNFPIPNTKADLFEFITSLQAKKNGKHGKAYKKKLNECMLKAKVLCPNDPIFIDIFNKIEEEDKKKLSIYILISIVMIIGIVILFSIPNTTRNSEDCSKAIVKAVNKGDLDKATELYTNFNAEKKDNLVSEAFMIQSAYLEKGEINSAENIYKLANARLEDDNSIKNDMAQQLHAHYIKHKNYDKARNMIETSERDYRLWGKHIMDVVISLCESGKKREAQNYLNLYASKIDMDFDRFGEGSNNSNRRVYATKSIQNIINKY